jgi:hypothetical protein
MAYNNKSMDGGCRSYHLDDEIKAAAHKVARTKRQRNMTTALLPFCKVEEVIQGIGCKQ